MLELFNKVDKFLVNLLAFIVVVTVVASGTVVAEAFKIMMSKGML